MTEGRGARHKKEPRGGQPKSGRASSKSQAQKRQLRYFKGRVKAAAEEVERNRKWLEAEERRAAEEMRDWAKQQAVTAAVVQFSDNVVAEPVPRETPRLRVVPNPALGPPRTSLAEARQMIRDGYHVKRVIERTGWGLSHFEDLIGNDGYVRPGN